MRISGEVAHESAMISPSVPIDQKNASKRSRTCTAFAGSRWRILFPWAEGGRDRGDDLTRTVSPFWGRSGFEAEAVAAAGFAEGGSDRLVGSVEIEPLGTEAAPDPGS